MLQLITRGDDAGSSCSANRAIRQCCEHGLLRNVSVMACGPAFNDAVRVLDGLKNVDFGLHIVLNAEWDAPRWGSILPRAQVPSLLDDSGMFIQTPLALRQRGFCVDEALCEIDAQLERARAAGLKISYLDEHMGVSWIVPALREGIADLAQREGLVDAHGFAGLSGVDTTDDDALNQLKTALSSTRCGVYTLVTHPAFDDEAARAFKGMGQSGEEIARNRNRERLFWQNTQLPAIVAECGARVVRYTEV